VDPVREPIHRRPPMVVVRGGERRSALLRGGEEEPGAEQAGVRCDGFVWAPRRPCGTFQGEAKSVVAVTCRPSNDRWANVWA
jgi:hypothetical protein